VVSPFPGRLERHISHVSRQLTTAPELFRIGSSTSEDEASAVRALIATAARRGIDAARKAALLSVSRHGAETQRIRALISVVADLISHGWDITLNGREMLATVPSEEFRGSGREYVRRIQLGQREHQLNKPSVRDFIRSMEKKRLGPHGWVSIFSLIRDGNELAGVLRTHERSKLVPEAINPYIQIIESAEHHCDLTGLRLMDIWRYFRYTWAMPYNSVPGRSMLILIRDASVENNPVIGIAALGSAIVQLSGRDAWIGWTPATFLPQIRQRPTTAVAKWIVAQLRKSLSSIYKADLLKQGILTAGELNNPSKDTMLKLRKAANVAWLIHRKYPGRKEHKLRAYTNTHWKKQTLLPLFRAKRCETLCRLLQVKKALNDCEFTPTVASLNRLLSLPSGIRAIEILLRTAKAEHVGIDMLDITICGAIPPYNPILGGKLVALLLCGPEVVRAYWKRYKKTPSVIASSMAGHRICRTPRLVLLGTTSLYGQRPNQYDRVQIPAGTASSKDAIRYTYLGESGGFGSSHFCRETVEELELMLSQSSRGRRVNSIFGEGVSPRLRKIRDGLNLLGFQSDAVLRHGNSRLVYGVPLASNFRDVLLGLSDVPRYALPQINKRRISDSIARYWGERWLTPRLANHPEAIDSVAANDLRLPDRHAARVKLPDVMWETLPLFA
jgi:hypothetical protein